MIEPANESAPITAESMLVNETSYVIGVPALTYFSSSPAATSAAAPPPAPLKIATICGIAVIFTRCAEMIADRRADDQRRDDHDPVDDPLRQRRDDRDQHPGQRSAGCRARAVFGELR